MSEPLRKKRKLTNLGSFQRKTNDNNNNNNNNGQKEYSFDDLVFSTSEIMTNVCCWWIDYKQRALKNTEMAGSASLLNPRVQTELSRLKPWEMLKKISHTFNQILMKIREQNIAASRSRNTNNRERFSASDSSMNYSRNQLQFLNRIRFESLKDIAEVCRKLLENFRAESRRQAPSQISKTWNIDSCIAALEMSMTLSALYSQSQLKITQQTRSQLLEKISDMGKRIFKKMLSITKKDDPPPKIRRAHPHANSGPRNSVAVQKVTNAPTVLEQPAENNVPPAVNVKIERDESSSGAGPSIKVFDSTSSGPDLIGPGVEPEESQQKESHIAVIKKENTEKEMSDLGNCSADTSGYSSTHESEAQGDKRKRKRPLVSEDIMDMCDRLTKDIVNVMKNIKEKSDCVKSNTAAPDIENMMGMVQEFKGLLEISADFSQDIQGSLLKILKGSSSSA